MPRPKAPEIRELKVVDDGVLATIFFPGAAAKVGDATLSSLLGRAKPGPTPGATRKGPKKVDAILAALAAGAESPVEIAKRTGLENSRIHAFLVYLRKRGDVRKIGKRYVLAKRKSRARSRV